LVAYLETRVACSPFYLAADPCHRKEDDGVLRHGFPKTKAVKEEPESEDPEVGDVVPVDTGAEVNKSYAMSDGEDDEDGEWGEGAGAAASDAGEAAAADAVAPDAAAAAAAEAAQA
jgi:hypothetical protein